MRISNKITKIINLGVTFLKFIRIKGMKGEKEPHHKNELD